MFGDINIVIITELSNTLAYFIYAIYYLRNLNNYEKLGASCLMDDSNEVFSYLSKVLKESPVSKYTVKDWPIMARYLTDQKISKMLKDAPKQLSQR